MNNPLQMFGLFHNPTQFMQNIMSNSQIIKNPMIKNTFDMMQKGDNKGLEEMARNLCSEKGINPDEALKQVKSMFGM